MGHKPKPHTQPYTLLATEASKDSRLPLRGECTVQRATPRASAPHGV